ncbi:MAG: hypothetical protein JWL64_36 [Frankiales bacterium]|nr:hypothetical protein [Frankiales bacterium]
MKHAPPPHEAEPPNVAATVSRPDDSGARVVTGDDRSPAAGRGRQNARKLAGRAKLKTAEKLKVWVRAGGTCVLCGRYLLEGALTGAEVSLGELAHIVGQQASERSARGLHPMPREDRDNAENVILACGTCHGEIDDMLVTGILDVPQLNALKAAHEQRIRHVTTLPHDQRSLILRVIGDLRGNPGEVTRDTAARAAISTGRFPWFDLDRDRIGVEIDLRSVAGERAADDDYYRAACRVIDEVIDTKLRDAIKSGAVRHMSVFPWARLPLLVYLGSKLEDNTNIAVFQRHRATQDWLWDDDAPEHLFTVTTTGDLATATEALLQLDVSGTVTPGQLSEELTALARLHIQPDVPPSTDVLRSRASLDAFCKAVRETNATLDAHKGIRTLHVVGALPPAAAVELGRLHDRHIHPALVIHDRTDDGGYRRALEIR